jgi:hypothetical protein
MTHNEYTASITVYEDWAGKENDSEFSTVVIVEADSIEEAEEKVISYFDYLDVPGTIEQKVIIHKIVPKIK